MAVLPFLTTAVAVRNGEEVATDIPISVWPAPVRKVEVGGSYDHEAECPASYYTTLRLSNMRLTVGSTSYSIVDIQQHTFLPHCSLMLREMAPGGL